MYLINHSDVTGFDIHILFHGTKIIEAIRGIDSVDDESLKLQRKRLVSALSSNIDELLKDLGA